MIINGFSCIQCLFRLFLSFVFLIVMANSVSAEAVHDHHSKFSNPEVFAPVDKGWEEKSVKYVKKYKESDLVVTLGQQTHPVFKKLIAEYAKERNLKITLLHGTCGITSGRLLKKKVDVGAFCCPPGRNDRFPGMTFHSLGISPIALLVHPSNPVKNLTYKKAREIFQGKVNRWSDVEGADTKQSAYIKPVGRLHCKIRPGHWRTLLSNENKFSPSLFEVGVISDMISQVARNPAAIGWEVPIMVDVYKDRGKVRMLKVDGHSPTDLDYLLSGNYPLYRSYSLTTWDSSDKKEMSAKLVKFLQAQMEKIHEEIDYIPPSKLRKAGWKFIGDELVGEPESAHQGY